jgi:hypothetical protein
LETDGPLYLDNVGFVPRPDMATRLTRRRLAAGEIWK